MRPIPTRKPKAEIHIWNSDEECCSCGSDTCELATNEHGEFENINGVTNADGEKSAETKWSEEQEAIFEYFRSGTGNAMVEALAGSGKTTTIKAAFEHAPENRILYAVFNKKNQIEAQAKITDHRVDVKTLHSLGYQFIKRAWRNARPDDDVEVDRVSKVLDALPQLKADKEFVGNLLKLVGFLKNTTIKPTRADAEQVAEAQDLFLGSMFHDEKLVTSALLVMEASKIQDPAGRISFNDMVWLPVAMGWVRGIYDLVVVDEAQDMNLPQLTMARQACREGGRVVVVGDKNQAIYAFRGAVQNGMAMMKATLRAVSFPLTQSFRNPKAVARMVTPIVPAFRVPESAIEGLVDSCTDAFMSANVKVGDAILSRINAPLFPTALSLLRKNIPTRIEGRDIGKQLLTMARSMKAKSVPDFLKKVQAWEEKQGKRIEGSKNADKKLEQVKDIAETLCVIAESSSSVQDIEDRLNNLFGGIFAKEDEAQKRDAVPCVLLSSVHKAKGLEWDRVFMLSETFRQSKGGEELNIYYVALTRAKAELYLVGGVKPAPQPKNEPETKLEAKAKPLADPAQSAKPADAAKFAHPEYNIQRSVPGPLDNYDLPVGLQYRKVGEVIQWGGAEYVVTEVNDCRARAVCLSRAKKVVKFGDKEVEMEATARKIDISATVEPSTILRRMSDEEFQNFLNGNSRGRSEKTKTTSSGTGENNSMAKKEKTTAIQTPDAEHPWRGFTACIRKAIADKADPTATYKKMAKSYLKMRPSGFIADWKKAGGKNITLDLPEASKATKKSAPPARKGSAKAVPPPRPAKAAQAPAPVEEPAPAPEEVPVSE